MRGITSVEVEWVVVVMKSSDGASLAQAGYHRHMLIVFLDVETERTRGRVGSGLSGHHPLSVSLIQEHMTAVR